MPGRSSGCQRKERKGNAWAFWVIVFEVGFRLWFWRPKTPKDVRGRGAVRWRRGGDLPSLGVLGYRFWSRPLLLQLYTYIHLYFLFLTTDLQNHNPKRPKATQPLAFLPVLFGQSRRKPPPKTLPFATQKTPNAKRAYRRAVALGSSVGRFLGVF